MLSDIVTAISILSEIYNIYEKLKEDQILFRRLCERVQLFTKFLQELQTNCANPNYKPSASLKDYIIQLTTLLNEIKDFLTKHTKSNNSFYGSFKRIIITSSFRNKFTNDLNSLNQRINDCVTNLLPSLGINFEEQRRLDTEALKNQIDYVAGDVVNQLVQLNSKGNSSKMMELLTDIKSNSDDTKTEIMGQILALEKKISSNETLTKQDFVDLEELFHREKETLKAFLDEKLAEYNNQIQRGLHKVGEKIDEVLHKILNEINLSRDEKQKRQELLGQVIIPPSARVEVKETVLGMGGFGTVFLGIYGATKVAIKSLNSANGREMESVENEVLLMNYLGSQPNILTCYGIWKDTRGHTFIVLDYSPFGSLVQILNDFENFPEISIRLQVGWVVDLINAVSFIHQRKVKHKDIKADNLLVFNGLTVKLCDFGLSKKHSQSTVSSVLGGTQGFMAPEVVDGKGSGFPSDVFSWAMTFYQIVMRECPRVALSHSQLVGNLLIELEDKLDGVELGLLRSLLTNCIHKDPEERPLACDINEFMLRFLGDIGGDPRLGIRTGDEEMVSDFEGQLKKTKKINFVAQGIDGHKTADLKKAQEDAVKAAALKKSQKEAALRKAQEEAAAEELKKAQEEAVLKAAAEELKKVQEEAAAKAAAKLKKAQEEAVKAAELKKVQEKAAAKAAAKLKKAQEEAVKAAELKKVQEEAAAKAADFAPFYLLYSQQKEAALKKAQEEAAAKAAEELKKAQEEAAAKAAEELKKAQEEAALKKAQEDAANAAEWSRKRTLRGHSSYVNCLIQLADGRVVSGSNDETLKVWNVNTGVCERTLEGHSDYVFCLVELADGRVVSGSGDKTLRVWNVNTGVCERTLKGHSGFVKCLVALADGRVVSGGGDETLKVWNVNTGVCETLQGHSSWVECLVQLADGRVVSGGGGTLKVWNVNTGVCELTLEGHSGSVCCLVELADGRVVSGSGDKTLRAWNVNTGVCERTLEGHSETVLCLVQLADGRVVSGSRDDTLKVWNVNTGVCERTFKGHHHSVNCLVQLADGRVVSGSWDDTLKVWNVKKGVCERTLRGHSSYVQYLVTLADGRVVSGSGDSTLKVWNVNSGEYERTLKGHRRSVNCLIQ